MEENDFKCKFLCSLLYGIWRQEKGATKMRGSSLFSLFLFFNSISSILLYSTNDDNDIIRSPLKSFQCLTRASSISFSKHRVQFIERILNVFSWLILEFLNSLWNVCILCLVYVLRSIKFDNINTTWNRDNFTDEGKKRGEESSVEWMSIWTLERKVKGVKMKFLELLGEAANTS